MDNKKIGYIFLWRKLIDSRIWNNPELLKVWIWCLLKTNHADNWVPFLTGKGESEVFIKRGQFIFGRNSASEELKMKPSTIYKRMIKLKNIGNLEIKSNTHYSIITICNWEQYQNIKLTKEQAKEQASSRQVAGKEQASSTNNNDNNDNNDNKVNTKENITKETVENRFDEFWNIFPKKISKSEAKKKWKTKKCYKIAEQVITALKEQIKNNQINISDLQYCPLAATWLNQERWKDEIINPKKKSNMMNREDEPYDRPPWLTVKREEDSDE